MDEWENFLKHSVIIDVMLFIYDSMTEQDPRGNREAINGEGK